MGSLSLIPLMVKDGEWETKQRNEYKFINFSPSSSIFTSCARERAIFDNVLLDFYWSHSQLFVNQIARDEEMFVANGSGTAQQL